MRKKFGGGVAAWLITWQVQAMSIVGRQLADFVVGVGALPALLWPAVLPRIALPRVGI